MTREEKQKAIDALKISVPSMAVTREEFNTYIQTLNKVMDWLEQEPCADAVSREAVLEITAETGALETQARVKTLPSVTPKPRWIPVSERLPKSHGVYNVTRLIDEAYITDSCFYDGQGTWYDDTRINHDRKYLDDVIAWIPLPEPWEGESE